MPAEVTTMLDCASNYGVFKIQGSSDHVYTVTLHGSEGPAHCTCPAFKYSGADQSCKHIRTLWEGGACLYNPQWKDGVEQPRFTPDSYTYDRVVPGETCPACGGPMVAVRRAV